MPLELTEDCGMGFLRVMNDKTSSQKRVLDVRAGEIVAKLKQAKEGWVKVRNINKKEGRVKEDNVEVFVPVEESEPPDSSSEAPPGTDSQGSQGNQETATS